MKSFNRDQFETIANLAGNAEIEVSGAKTDEGKQLHAKFNGVYCLNPSAT